MSLKFNLINLSVRNVYHKNIYVFPCARYKSNWEDAYMCRCTDFNFLEVLMRFEYCFRNKQSLIKCINLILLSLSTASSLGYVGCVRPHYNRRLIARGCFMNTPFFPMLKQSCKLTALVVFL